MTTTLGRKKSRTRRSNPLKGSRGGMTAIYLFLTFLSALWVIPILGLLVSSLRTRDGVLSSGWWSALANIGGEEWSLDNYNNVLFDGGFGQAFMNSLVITVPTVILTATIALFAAYGFAWLRFKGNNLLFYVMVALLVVPLQVAFIPLLRLYNNIGLSYSWTAIWLTHTMFGVPIALFILTNFVRGIPHEIVEASIADGATHWSTFRWIVLPLSAPAVAAFCVFQFLWVWNDMLVALVFLGADPEHRPITVALQLLTGNRGQDWHVLTAGAFVSLILPAIVFLTLQRYLVRGLTAGAVK